nr:spermatogenesis-associated protein 13 isoform X2 [Parasteatoda tepidariorum]
MRLRATLYKPEKKVPPDQNKPGVQESALNVDQEFFSNSNTMGLGNNPVLDELDSNNEQNMVDEFIPFENSPLNSQNKSSTPMNKNKTSSILRLRNKNISRAERSSKGKSTSEVYDKFLRKSEKNVELKKRPKSQFYDIDEIETSISGTNLIEQSSVDSISHPALNNIDQLSELSEPSGALNSRNSSLHTSISQLSPADSLLKKFRKSFAVRFKKKTDLVSNNSNKSPCQSPVLTQEPIPNFQSYLHDSNSKEISNKDFSNPSVQSGKTCDINVPQTDLQKKINSSEHLKKQSANISNCRIKGKKKQDWRRSFFYDSVDNIFDSNKSSINKSYKMPQFAGSDANILRKRTASTSDYSPKFKDIQQPLSTVDSPSPETNCTKFSDHKNEVILNANSNAVNLEDHQKTITSLDQIWRSNPVKLCRVHSRLLMCRHKGRYRLRRSISQPVELEMSGSMHSLKESTHGSAEHETFQKSSLSSDDEVSSESDIYHSYCCSPTRRSNTCWELSGESAMYAEALWDHETIDTEELPFQAGDVLEVTDTSDQDWWWGIKDGQGGWFPSAFVRLYVSHRGPALHYNGQTTEEIPYSPSKVSMNNLSWEQVRANIVQEIVATERDYVKHLKDVVEGYLKQVQRRPDMFSKERIETVFGNIQEIYNFQSEFLKQLENCLDNDAPHLSQIGNCFLNHKEEFKMYSQYCNNHPLAVSELQELYCDSQYIHFFEACRLLQEMIDISLDGFLLTPIQRICKYPLQLAELLKFTDENHPDHIPVTNAFAAMKEVAELVNERKRRMECLERIAEWQNTIEGWEGPDVLDTSSILIHCGEVTRVSSSWSRDIYLFIFDHQLIYCKKDLLKRHTYAYKGRLNLDHCDIVDVDDGKDSHFAVTVKNAWKIYCRDKDKWYLFYAKTAPEKEQWIRAFKTERQRVSDDEKQAFIVTEEAKRSARLAVQNKQKPKRPRAKFAKGRRCHPDVAVTELLLDSPSAKARSGSLPSNIHPELAILTGAKLGPTRKKGSGWFHFGSGKKPKS